MSRRKTLGEAINLSDAEREFLQGKSVSTPQESIEVTVTSIKLDEIQDRSQEETRTINLAHVEELAESIGALGLIEPLVVDSRSRLLAGGHRRAAIAHLKSTNPEAYKKHFPGDYIRVNMMPFDSEVNPQMAFAIETAENEKRRDYTRAEVKAIAERLKAAGYEDVKGRPSEGQKPLMPALSVVIGKSIRTARRYLNEGESSKPQKSGTDDRLLKRALVSLEKWRDTKPKGKNAKNLVDKLPEIFDLIERTIEDERK